MLLRRSCVPRSSQMCAATQPPRHTGQPRSAGSFSLYLLPPPACLTISGWPQAAGRKRSASSLLTHRRCARAQVIVDDISRRYELSDELGRCAQQHHGTPWHPGDRADWLGRTMACWRRAIRPACVAAAVTPVHVSGHARRRCCCHHSCLCRRRRACLCRRRRRCAAAAAAPSPLRRRRTH